MNRQAKRHAEKRNLSKLDNVYIASERAIRNELEKQYSSLTLRALDEVVGLVLVTLHDKYGFRKQRLERFLNHITALYECMGNDENLKGRHFKEWLKEIGIDYEFHQKKEEEIHRMIGGIK